MMKEGKDINAMMAEALEKAKELVTGDRQKDYGTPRESFGRIAALWADYLGVRITAEQVAIMMALLKIGRSAGGRKTPDTYYDLIGYGAIAYALRPNQEPPVQEDVNKSSRGTRCSPEVTLEIVPGGAAELKTGEGDITTIIKVDMMCGIKTALEAAKMLEDDYSAFHEWREKFNHHDFPLFLVWQAGARHGRANLPEGWVTVRAVPTENMLHAGGRPENRGNPGAIWDAMLAYSPRFSAEAYSLHEVEEYLMGKSNG